MTSDGFDLAVRVFLTELEKHSGPTIVDDALSIAQKAQPNGDGFSLIEYALDHHVVEKVIDYPPEDWDSFEKPIWYVRTLSSEDAESHRSLPPHEWALLKLLWNQNDRDHLGQMKLEAVRAELRRQGFTEDDLEVLTIDGLVDHFFTTEDDVMTEWCYVLPEWEKTEEYRRSEEEIQRQALEKEGLKMHFAHIDDVEFDITELLLGKPHGMSLEQIKKQLRDTYSARDISEALNQAVAFGYIKRTRGKTGVRYTAVKSDD